LISGVSSSMAEPILLVGDIGGTNARFALATTHDGRFSHGLSVQCRDYPSIEQALDEYLGKVGAGKPDAICLAAAGPVNDGRVRLTNNDWSIDSQELGDAFGSARVRLINDFEAIAYSLPLLAADERVSIGSRLPELAAGGSFKVAVLGPGTGLGMAGLVSQDGRVQHVVGEGGHTGFAPTSADQVSVMMQLRKRFDHVCNEQVISGPGLENVYAALCQAEGQAHDALNAQDVFERAITASDTFAVRAVALFFEALGQAAGDLALLIGAFDGVYIAGGIVRRYPQLLHRSRFRAGFENKGVCQAMMEKIPTALVTHPDPGLLGASQCARDLLA
jgi:glucokinase